MPTVSVREEQIGVVPYEIDDTTDSEGKATYFRVRPDPN